MEQLLHTGPDHPVKEQDDSTDFDCYTSRSGLYEFRYGKIYMMITVAIVPIIVVYLLLSKYIIAGVTLGGVKE